MIQTFERGQQSHFQLIIPNHNEKRSLPFLFWRWVLWKRIRDYRRGATPLEKKKNLIYEHVRGFKTASLSLQLSLANRKGASCPMLPGLYILTLPPKLLFWIWKLLNNLNIHHCRVLESVCLWCDNKDENKAQNSSSYFSIFCSYSSSYLAITFTCYSKNT